MSHKNLIILTLLGLLFIGISLLILGFIWAYDEVFYPAYLSVQAGCYISEKELNSMGYRIAGTYSEGGGVNVIIPYLYDDSWYMRNIYMESEKYKRTEKHELCHLHQKKQNRLNDCSQPIRLFLDECECYFLERF